MYSSTSKIAHTAVNDISVNAGILDLSSIDFYNLDNLCDIFEPRFEFVVDSPQQTLSEEISYNSNHKLKKKLPPQPTTTLRKLAKQPRSANIKFTLELLSDKISNIEVRLSAIERNTITENHCGGCKNTYTELITELRSRAEELRSFLL